MQTRKLARLLAGQSDLTREIGEGMSADLAAFGELADREQTQRRIAYKNRSTVLATREVQKIAAKAIAEREAQAEANDPTIVATRHDIRSAAMSACASRPSDSGLRSLVAALKKRWDDSPSGVVSRAELGRLAAHFDRQYPNSLASDVLKKAGASSLARVDRKKLNKLAEQIVRVQDPEERRSVFARSLKEHGFSGASPDAVRARFYLEGRIAQLQDLNNAAPIDSGAPSDMSMPDAAPSPAGPDADIGVPPHEEAEETSAEVVSPSTGETLVVELAPSGDAPADAPQESLADFGEVSAFLRSAAFDTDQALRELGPYIETTGQLFPTKQGILRNLMQKVRAGSYSSGQAVKLWKLLVDEGAKAYVREFAMGAVQNVFTAAVRDKLARQLEEKYAAPLQSGEYEYLVHQAQLDLTPVDDEADPADSMAMTPDQTPTVEEEPLSDQEAVIEDPSKPGEMLKLTIEPALEEDAQEVQEFSVFEGEDDLSPPSMTVEAFSMRDAIARIALSDRYSKRLENARVSAYPSSFERCAEVGDLTVVRADLLSLARAADAKPVVAESAPTPSETVPVSEAQELRLLTAAQAQAVCDMIGYTEKALTASIMRGEPVTFGKWSMVIDDSGDIAVKKTGAKKAKSFPLSKRADAVRAMAVRIAESAKLREPAAVDASPIYTVKCLACKSQGLYPLDKAAAVQCGACKKGISVHAVKTAVDAQAAKPAQDYLVAIRFPSFGNKDAQALALNGERARTLIAEVAKNHEVLSDAGGEMAVVVRSASLATINRIKTVLSDRLGVTAQALPANPAQRAMMPNAQPPMPGVGAPASPAAPAPPAQGPLQPTPNVAPGQTPTAPRPAAGSDAQAQAMEKVKDMGNVMAQKNAEKQQAATSKFAVRVRGQAVIDLPAEAPPAEAPLPDAPAKLPAAEILPEGELAVEEFAPAEDIGALDVATSVIDAEGEDLVKSAITHYRNTGSGVATAIKDFLTQYKAFLDDFGDETSPERQMAEAAVLRIAKEVYEKPAVLREASAKPKPGNAGAVLGPDSSQTEPKVLDPKLDGQSGTNVPVESMSVGNTEGDLPKPKQKPGHDIGPAVSMGKPESVFKETMKTDEKIASRGWGVKL